MASLVRPLQTDLLNTRSQVGDSPLEKAEHKKRVAVRLRKMQLLRERAARVDTQLVDVCIRADEHGAPTDFDIYEARRKIKDAKALCGDACLGDTAQMRGPPVRRGVVAISRGRHEENQHQRVFVDATEEQRMANVYHARRKTMAVVGRNFVPIDIYDLPPEEREELLRSRANSVDRLMYEVRNNDYLRDYWRTQVQEREGAIQRPPFGVPGVC